VSDVRNYSQQRTGRSVRSRRPSERSAQCNQA